MKFAWINEPPFNYVENGELKGRDVDLARAAFAAIGEAFEPVETVFSELLSGLRDGRWHVTTGMFITPERSQLAFFTRPIWTLFDGLLVRSDDARRIGGYRDVARSGEKLAVLRAQVQEQTALSLGVTPASILVFEDYADAAEAVLSGEAIAYASVELAHRAHLAANPGLPLACVAVPPGEKAGDEGGFACASAAVRDRLNDALKGLERG